MLAYKLEIAYCDEHNYITNGYKLVEITQFSAHLTKKINNFWAVLDPEILGITRS